VAIRRATETGSPQSLGRCHGARSGGPCRLELGGVIVREVARELPDHVDGVVLFGSPIIGGPTHTIAARAFDPAEAALATAALEALDAERPVRVPLTSI
jgi:pimeloyl-ACP methyl ester carboxylesterase